MQSNEERELRKMALARQVLGAVQSPLWTEVIRPYLENERAAAIENMAHLTDAMQLMRYAGSVQTLHSLLNLETTARAVIDSKTEQTLKQFKN